MRTLFVNGLRLSSRPTGPGRHIQFLLEQWSRMDIPFDRIVLAARDTPRLDGVADASRIEVRVFATAWPPFAWEQVALPRALDGAALLFCPAYTGPVLCRGRVVVANHGIYERLPGEFSVWTRLRATPLNRRSARRADRVIANSLATKADLVRYFGLRESKIDVVYPAAHEVFFARHAEADVAREVERALGARVPYALFVGKLARRRNVPSLIEAFGRARREGGLPHRLLIVGPNTSGIPLAELAARADVADAVTYIPYLEQEPLARLYAGADVFVLPTTYEGISQTMFEAMASGAPVLTVEHPTLAEGADDAVLAVPMPSAEDLARGLVRLLPDRALREDLARRGRDHARRFSWAATARATMEILDRVALPGDREP